MSISYIELNRVSVCDIIKCDLFFVDFTINGSVKDIKYFFSLLKFINALIIAEIFLCNICIFFILLYKIE